MRLALAQINSVVGDLDGNRALILERLDDARTAGAELIVFPELSVTGYPPEDLLLRPGFIRAAEASVESIARAARGTTVLVGHSFLGQARPDSVAVRHPHHVLMVDVAAPRRRGGPRMRAGLPAAAGRGRAVARGRDRRRHLG